MGKKSKCVNLGFTGSLNSKALTVYTVDRGVSIKGNRCMPKSKTATKGFFFETIVL